MIPTRTLLLRRCAVLLFRLGQWTAGDSPLRSLRSIPQVPNRASCSCRSDSFSLCLPYLPIRSGRSSSFELLDASAAAAMSLSFAMTMILRFHLLLQLLQHSRDNRVERTGKGDLEVGFILLRSSQILLWISHRISCIHAIFCDDI